jgi:antitoxin FitA
MATITIRGLDEAVKARLRLRAARHSRSMEEEARQILKTGLATESGGQPNLAEAIRRHIEPMGGIEVTLPRREAVRRPPKFGK